MDTCSKQYSGNKIARSQLELQGNKKIFISSSHESTLLTRENSTSDYPAMNTRSKVLKRSSSDSQQSQHPGKKKKTSTKVKKQLVTLPEVQGMEVFSPIQMLDDDCLTLVFLHLPPDERLRIESVCKKWRSVNRSALWSIKKLNYPYVEPDWDEVRKKIPGSLFYIPQTLREFKRKFTYIPRVLALRREYFQELDLSALTQTIILTKLGQHSFPNLIKLKLRITYDWKPEHCDNLFDKMTKLESLHLTSDYRRNIPNRFYQALTSLANTLKELSIIRYTYHGHPHQHVSEHRMLSILGRGLHNSYLCYLIELKLLRFLELGGFVLEIESFEALKHFNLEKLIIARCTVREEAGLSFLFHQKKLKELALGPCDENIDAFLNKISNQWNNLSKLILLKPNASRETIKAISRHQVFTTHVVNDSKGLASARLQN